MWQLIRDGKVIKEFPTWDQCAMEAQERGWVLDHGCGYRLSLSLLPGVRIQQVSNPTKPELRNV